MIKEIYKESERIRVKLEAKKVKMLSKIEDDSDDE
jgi:hypothetical protein